MGMPLTHRDLGRRHLNRGLDKLSLQPALAISLKSKALLMTLHQNEPSCLFLEPSRVGILCGHLIVSCVGGLHRFLSINKQSCYQQLSQVPSCR